jgi:hypothetical protein
MWTYALVVVTALSVAAALFFWRIYVDAIRREVATAEILCGVLLSPLLHVQFQRVAYERIKQRFPPGEDHPSELERELLLQELISLLGNSALAFVTSNSSGTTLRRILTGPWVVGRDPDELWRYAKPPQGKPSVCDIAYSKVVRF